MFGVDQVILVLNAEVSNIRDGLEIDQRAQMSLSSTNRVDYDTPLLVPIVISLAQD